MGENPLTILFFIHFFRLMNDSLETVCNSLQWSWDFSLLPTAPWVTTSKCKCPEQPWQDLMPALTNTCGLADFLHQLLFQMIGSKTVTGVMGFITSLQEEIWGHLNFLNSWMLSYPNDFSSHFMTYVIIILLKTKIARCSNLFPSLHQVCKIFRKARDKFWELYLFTFLHN